LTEGPFLNTSPDISMEAHKTDLNAAAAIGNLLHVCQSGGRESDKPCEWYSMDD